MKSRLLFLSVVIIAFFNFNQKAEAQGGIAVVNPDVLCDCDYVPPQHDTTGYGLIKCNTSSGADEAACNDSSTSGNLGVHFAIYSTVITLGDTTYIASSEMFKNKTSCTENFVTCSMVEYAAPEMAQNHLDTNYSLKLDSMLDSVGLIMNLDTDAFGTTLMDWQLTQNSCGACSTGCNYTCAPLPPTFVEDWSYYFGCTDVNLAPGHSIWIGGNWQTVYAPILATHEGSGPTLDTATQPIILSPNTANIKDSSISTWNYNGYYMDFLKGCQFLPGSGCDFGNEPGQEVSLQIDDATCINSIWYYPQRIETAYHGRSYPTGIVSFPIGNQATSSVADTANAHTVYQAEFIGELDGAPAGSELMIYAPEDTSHGAAVIDSGWVWTDTVGDCQSDTLKFEFQFEIPPEQYLDRGMTFIVYFPSDSCSNVGNGKRINLNGLVYATATTPLYDSGAFMYNAQSVMILDTTPPVITNFIAIPVDSTHLAIQLTGIDDTTVVPFGFVEYTINDGPEQLMPLTFADSSVSDSTTFIDTLLSPVSHPTIHIKGFVANQLGVLDSSTSLMEVLPPKAAPQGDVVQTEDSLRVNYLMIDHSSKTLTLDVQAVGAPIELDLVTEDGRSTKLTFETSSPDGEQKFVQSISNFANGAYFLVIKSGNNSIIKNIVL